MSHRAFTPRLLVLIAGVTSSISCPDRDRDLGSSLLRLAHWQHPASCMTMLAGCMTVRVEAHDQGSRRGRAACKRLPTALAESSPFSEEGVEQAAHAR